MKKINKIMAVSFTMVLVLFFGMFLTLDLSPSNGVLANGFTPYFTPEGIFIVGGYKAIINPTPIPQGGIVGVLHNNAGTYLFMSTVRYGNAPYILGQNIMYSDTRTINMFDVYNDCKYQVRAICNSSAGNANLDGLCYDSPIGNTPANLYNSITTYYATKYRAFKRFSSTLSVGANAYSAHPSAIYNVSTGWVTLPPTAATFNGRNITPLNTVVDCPSNGIITYFGGGPSGSGSGDIDGDDDTD